MLYVREFPHRFAGQSPLYPDRSHIRGSATAAPVVAHALVVPVIFRLNGQLRTFIASTSCTEGAAMPSFSAAPTYRPW